MQIPARVKSLLSFSAVTLATAILLLTLPFILNKTVQAQEMSVAEYAKPNFNPDVPLNQHTFTQSVLIETISSVYCLITGIDPVDPSQGCLDLDPVTKKLALNPPDEKNPQLGGILSLAPPMFSYLYIPPVSSGGYFNYLASNFGIVQPARAQSYNGFESLEPLAPMWISIRNVAYLVFVVIFIIIGLGIMLRIKIDPRTVMTLQNQIPRIIISILLVTFSYSIVGLMIDLMWLATYTGINVLTESNPAVTNPPGCWKDETGMRVLLPGTGLQQRTGEVMQDSVFPVYNTILEGESIGFLDETGCYGGIAATTQTVSNVIGGLIKELIQGMMEGGLADEIDPAKAPQCTWDRLWGGESIYFSDCLKEKTGLTPGAMVGGIIGWLANIVTKVIIFCVIIWTLFRIWFALLRAYIMIILYTISAPLWIIMGLLPSKPLGFEKWFRRIFANLAVFPATIMLFLIASILANSMSFYNPDNQAFTPPLIGSPNISYFGYLIAFGILLVTPSLLDILRSSLNAVGKHSGTAASSITNMIAGGSAYPKGVAGAVWNRTFGVNRRGQAGIGLQHAINNWGPVGRALKWISGAQTNQGGGGPSGGGGHA